MNITRKNNNNKDKQWFVMHKTLHHITSQAGQLLAASAVGGSLYCASGHGGVGTIVVVVIMVLM
jgi:hypothetical protein